MSKGIKILIILIVIALIAGVFLLKRGTESSSKAEEILLAEEERIPLEYTAFDMDAFLEPGLPLMIDMGSASCGPCLQMKPDL